MQWIQASYKRVDISIKWSQPKTIEQACEIGTDANLYKLIVEDNKGVFQLVYIGRCIKQKFTKRILQKDHIEKRANFLANNKKLKLFVSLGNVDGDIIRKPKELNDLESLLIFSHSDERFNLFNKQCTLTHNVVKNYLVINKGWRKDKMYKAIGYGLFMTGN